jgi:hypothetical protein
MKSVDACAHVLQGCQTAGKAWRCTDRALADTPGQCRYHCVGMCCLDGEVHRTGASVTYRYFVCVTAGAYFDQRGEFLSRKIFSRYVSTWVCEKWVCLERDS